MAQSVWYKTAPHLNSSQGWLTVQYLGQVYHSVPIPISYLHWCICLHLLAKNLRTYIAISRNIREKHHTPSESYSSFKIPSSIQHAWHPKQTTQVTPSWSYSMRWVVIQNSFEIQKWMYLTKKTTYMGMLWYNQTYLVLSTIANRRNMEEIHLTFLLQLAPASLLLNKNIVHGLRGITLPTRKRTRKKQTVKQIQNDSNSIIMCRYSNWSIKHTHTHTQHKNLQSTIK